LLVAGLMIGADLLTNYARARAPKVAAPEVMLNAISRLIDMQHLC